MCLYVHVGQNNKEDRAFARRNAANVKSKKNVEQKCLKKRRKNCFFALTVNRKGGGLRQYPIESPQARNCQTTRKDNTQQLEPQSPP